MIVAIGNLAVVSVKSFCIILKRLVVVSGGGLFPSAPQGGRLRTLGFLVELHAATTPSAHYNNSL